jgi:hypothetical protein
VTVVVIPAINGKAPQTPHPIAPRKKFLGISFLKIFFFYKCLGKKKGLKL